MSLLSGFEETNWLSAACLCFTVEGVSFFGSGGVERGSVVLLVCVK